MTRPPPFSMASKLLMVPGEAKSSKCFSLSCVPESMFKVGLNQKFSKKNRSSVFHGI